MTTKLKEKSINEYVLKIGNYYMLVTTIQLIIALKLLFNRTYFLVSLLTLFFTQRLLMNNNFQEVPDYYLSVGIIQQ